MSIEMNNLVGGREEVGGGGGGDGKRTHALLALRRLTISHASLMRGGEGGGREWVGGAGMTVSW